MNLGPDVDPGVAPLLTLFGVVDALMIAVGWLVRTGRFWVLSINVVAIQAFIYLAGFPNVALVFFGLLSLAVLFALLRHRPWFEAMRSWRADERERTSRGLAPRP